MNGEKLDIKKYRHPAERIMHGISFLINCAVIVLLSLYFTHNTASEESFEMLAETVNMERSYAELIFRYKELAAILLIVIVVFEIWHAVSSSAGACMTRDLIIDEITYPSLYERTRMYADRLGMKEVPHVFATYREAGERVFNAGIHEKAIIIDQGAPGVASEYGDRDSYDAYMLTEMIHIALHHRDFRLQALTFFARCIPLYSQAYERVMQYSVDNVLKELVGPEKAVEYICRQNYDAWTPCYIDMRREVSSKLTVYDKWKNGKLPLGTSLAITFSELLESKPAVMFRIVRVLGVPEYKHYLHCDEAENREKQ